MERVGRGGAEGEDRERGGDVRGRVGTGVAEWNG